MLLSGLRALSGKVLENMSVKKPRSSRLIRHVALQTLKAHDAVLPPVPVERIAAELHVRIRYSPFDGELAGMLYCRNGVTVIGVNSLHSHARQRFTIAHELGHFKLHGADVHIDRRYAIHRDWVSSLGTDAKEIEANRFAAELLMPYGEISKDLLKKEIDIEDEDEIRHLASKYKVSLLAMSHRVNKVASIHKYFL